MWFGLFLVMIAVPLLELALLIKLGQSIGVLGVIAVIFVTAGTGIVIMQAQGLATFNRAMESARQGKPPVEPAVDSFMLLTAGGLLFAPGLITDTIGALLLVPPIRRAVGAWAMRRFLAGADVHVSTWTMDSGPRTSGHPAGPSRGEREAGLGDKVIEGEFEVVDEQATKRRSDPNHKDGGKAP